MQNYPMVSLDLIAKIKLHIKTRSREQRYHNWDLDVPRLDPIDEEICLRHGNHCRSHKTQRSSTAMTFPWILALGGGILSKVGG